jgi:hypothetical protein
MHSHLAETRDVQARKTKEQQAEQSLNADLAVLERSNRDRAWTDKSGRLLAKARFAKLVGDRVYLQKTIGGTLAVPLARLSTADVNYLSRYPMGPVSGHGPLVTAVSQDGKLVEVSAIGDLGFVSGQVLVVARPKLFRYEYGAIELGKPTVVARIRVRKVDGDRAIAEVIWGRGQVRVRDQVDGKTVASPSGVSGRHARHGTVSVCGDGRYTVHHAARCRLWIPHCDGRERRRQW